MARTSVFALAAVAIAAFIALATRNAAGAIEPGNAPGVLMSRQLMESRQLRVGDLVRLSSDPSGARAREFRILAACEPTPDPLRFAQQSFGARLHLPDLLALTANPSDPNAADTLS